MFGNLTRTLQWNAKPVRRKKINKLIDATRWDEAEDAAQALVEAYPDDPGSYVELGRVFGAEARYEESLYAFEQALQRDSRNRDALFFSVASLGNLKRWGEAEKAARILKESYPDEIAARCAFADVLEKEKRYEDALLEAEEIQFRDSGSRFGISLHVDALYGLRHWDEAEAKAQDLVSRYPRESQPQLILGKLFHAQGRYGDALSSFQKGLSLDRTNKELLKWRIKSLRAQHRWREAETAAREAIQLLPNSPEPYVEFAKVFVAEGRNERALKHVERSLELDSLHPSVHSLHVDVLLNLLRFEDAQAAAQEYVDQHPQSFEARTALGRVLFKRHDYVKALDEYDRAHSLNPVEDEAVAGMSAALRSTHRFAEAERLMAAACAQYPQAVGLQAELAEVYCDRRDYKKAQEVFRGLLSIAISSAERAVALQGLGWVAFAEGEYDDARKHFDDSANSWPRLSGVKTALAWAELRRDKLKEADVLCHESLKDDARDHLAHTCLGVVAFKRGDWADAEYHFRRSVEIAPFDGSYVDLGALYVQLARYGEAEECLLRATELNYYDSQTHVELGNLYLRRWEGRKDGDAYRKDMTRAVSEFRQALKFDSQSTGAAIGLALALASNSGDMGAAEEVLHQAVHIRKPGGDAQLHLALARLLIQAGDAQQRNDLYEQALVESKKAINRGASNAEAHFISGLAEQRLGNVADANVRISHRRKAKIHFRNCRNLQTDHIEAERALQLLGREVRAAYISRMESRGLAMVAFLALVAVWIDFVWKHHVTATMATTLTPILVGMIAVGILMPLLIRLKLPGGLEAQLSASLEQISSGPIGDLPKIPMRFPPYVGPLGYLPNRTSPRM